MKIQPRTSLVSSSFSETYETHRKTCNVAVKIDTEDKLRFAKTCETNYHREKPKNDIGFEFQFYDRCHFIYINSLKIRPRKQKPQADESVLDETNQTSR